MGGSGTGCAHRPGGASGWADMKKGAPDGTPFFMLGGKGGWASAEPGRLPRMARKPVQQQGDPQRGGGTVRIAFGFHGS